ncbi:unnamed protein product [Adineta steineri]|uniref:Uncharacterized protein n=1 Tax=Adineta steineri TaxID=433720 RepID=A0A814YF31_9BILA|nr:unnamed protein product [Adineta steineri]CAF1315080.1 unnamed protein product [Adineta steineri]
MKRLLLSILFVLFINKCVSQRGFPKQFQTSLNISGSASAPILTPGVQYLLYDYNNLRVRFDVQGWRAQQNETYMIKYKPEGAEADSPASQGYTMFNFNPDYPALTKNDCWYRTNPMGDVGPFPWSWFYGSNELHTEIQRWFPLPSNLINMGDEWIPEIQENATRYDSPEICDLKRSGRGKVPCLSYFETKDRPARTITARAAQGSYDADDYIITTYLSFTNGIPSEAEHLFDVPKQWPSYCGNANTGFDVDPVHGYVVTPDGQDHFQLKLKTPPVHALGDEIKIEFKVQPNWYYNGTRCAQFNPIIFNKTNWQVPQKVDMSFIDYGCCTYEITANSGGYDWQYQPNTFVVYACDRQAGYGCKGREPCGG